MGTPLADPHRIGKRLLPLMDDTFERPPRHLPGIYRIDDKARIVDGR